MFTFPLIETQEFNMPKRIIVSTIHAYREGKMVAFTPGQHVDLTVDELDEIKKVNPRAVRVPVNEDRATFTDAELAQQFTDAAAKAAADVELARKEAIERSAALKDAADKEADRKNADAAKAKDDAEKEAADKAAADKTIADKAAVAKANVGGKGTAGKPSTVSDL